jgi:hypothetical protein
MKSAERIGKDLLSLVNNSVLNEKTKELTKKVMVDNAKTFITLIGS